MSKRQTIITWLPPSTSPEDVFGMTSSDNILSDKIEEKISFLALSNQPIPILRREANAIQTRDGFYIAVYKTDLI